MNQRTQARETRLVVDVTSLIDYTSRVLGAIESGNWHYAADKLHGLREAVDRLEHDLAPEHVAELRQISGPGVWKRVKQLTVPYWLGRAIDAWNRREGGDRG